MPISKGKIIAIVAIVLIGAAIWQRDKIKAMFVSVNDKDEPNKGKDADAPAPENKKLYGDIEGDIEANGIVALPGVGLVAIS